MIRPQIVLYTEEWRPGVIELARAAGWTEEMQTWEWNPLMTMLAIHKGRVVGFIAGWAGQPVGMMDGLTVHPDYNHQGVGVFLVRKMTQHLFRLGAARVRCITSNAEVERLLGRHGYSVIERGVMMEGRG